MCVVGGGGAALEQRRQRVHAHSNAGVEGRDGQQAGVGEYGSVKVVRDVRELPLLQMIYI